MEPQTAHLARTLAETLRRAAPALDDVADALAALDGVPAEADATYRALYRLRGAIQVAVDDLLAGASPGRVADRLMEVLEADGQPVARRDRCTGETTRRTGGRAGISVCRCDLRAGHAGEHEHAVIRRWTDDLDATVTPIRGGA